MARGKLPLCSRGVPAACSIYLVYGHIEAAKAQKDAEEDGSGRGVDIGIGYIAIGSALESVASGL
jgi:hypothetical protein